MKNLTKTINFCEVQKFVDDFQVEYPHLYPMTTLDEVAGFLSQPHIMQYDKNPDKELVKRFRMNLYADWLLANQLTEVSM